MLDSCHPTDARPQLRFSNELTLTGRATMLPSGLPSWRAVLPIEPSGALLPIRFSRNGVFTGDQPRGSTR